MLKLTRWIPIVAVFALWQNSAEAVSFSAQPAPNVASNGFIVKFTPNSSRVSQSHALTTAGAKVVERFSLVPDLSFVKSVPGQNTADSIRILKSNPSIAYVEPDYLVSISQVASDPRFSEQYGLNNVGQTGGQADADVDAVEAWDVATGNNVAVAVIDTGVDVQHEDLVASIWTNPNEIPNNGVDDDSNGYIDDIRGWDFANNDNDPSDDHYHGTHVAGIIAARMNNGFGGAGIAPNARIMPLKFIDKNGIGSTSNAIRAINYAVAMGARISNSSWGGAGFSQALYDTINAAYRAGHLFVAASGNEGINSDDPANLAHYPSSYDLPNVISVGASDASDLRATFSNWGPTSVDLLAPGQKILSSTPGNSYQLLDGTSMAAPFVAGTAALLLERIPDLSVERLRAAILDNVDPVQSMAGIVVTGGRLNSLRAINSLKANIRVIPNTAILAINNSQTFSASGGSAPYTYELTNPSVGQLNSSTGYLYATAAGTTQVKATDSGGFSGFSGDIRVVQISIMPNQGQMKVGDSLQFTAIGGTPPYRWRSSNPNLANIDINTGLLRAISGGQIQIDVQDLNGVNAISGIFTILDLPVIQLIPMTAALQPGETLQFRASGGTPPYRWSVSDTSVASIDSNGLLTTVNSGVINITVTDSRNISTKSGDIAIDGILITIGTTTLRVRQSANLSVTGGEPPYQWRVTNSSVATVDKNGVLTALTPGSIKVSIMDAQGRLGRSQTVFVTDGVQLSLFPRDKAIAAGTTSTVKLSGGVAPYSWTSSNPAVLSIDGATGTISGNIPGVAFINVADASGQIASSGAIEVRQIDIQPNTASLVSGQALQMSVSGGKSPYRWSLNSTALASISDQGLLTAIAPGTIAAIVSDADGVTARSGQISIASNALGVHVIDIKPNTAVLSRRSTTPLQFVANGGAAPYSYRLTNNTAGTINTVTGEFLPNANTPATTTIIVTDVDGHSAESGTITVQ